MKKTTHRACTTLHALSTLSATFVACQIGTAHAQETTSDGEALANEVIVQGSRLPASLETMPQSIDILKAEDVSTQLAVTGDMQEILANLVPGLSRSSNATISTYLSLRGRKPVILVDGIPVTATLNDTAREVNLIDP